MDYPARSRTRSTGWSAAWSSQTSPSRSSTLLPVRSTHRRLFAKSLSPWERVSSTLRVRLFALLAESRTPQQLAADPAIAAPIAATFQTPGR